MSSAVATAPSTLLRRPEPRAPRAATPDPRITITGTLRDDAHASTEPATGRAAFHVVIAQGGDAPDIVATRWVGDGPDAAMYAHDRAAGLCAGDIVTVHGDGLRLRYRHGTLVLELIAVRDIELEQLRAERAA